MLAELTPGTVKKRISTAQAKTILTSVRPRDLVGKTRRSLAAEQLAELVVIEKKMFSNTEELLPVISFNAKASADEARKHEDFVNRMVQKGYTPKQVRLLCEWYLRVRKSS